jgi:hypothetical protein
MAMLAGFGWQARRLELSRKAYHGWSRKRAMLAFTVLLGGEDNRDAGDEGDRDKIPIIPFIPVKM